jgi:transcriptional regulator with XRE-family HTH domain
MLSQIERGQTNATFATLWNVTSALHIDLSDLIGSEGKYNESGPLEHVAAHQTPAMKSVDGLCTLRILSPAKLGGITEWYELEALAKGRLESAPHGSGCTEHLTCLSGQLVATSNGESTARLKVGDTVRYRADVSHAIENPTNRTARALLILTF